MWLTYERLWGFSRVLLSTMVVGDRQIWFRRARILSKKSPKIMFSAVLDNFWTFFGHFSDILSAFDPFFRVGFWQNGLFADFILGPPDFFVDFVAGSFLHILWEKKGPEKPSRKIPGKILQILYTKIPDTFLQRGWANVFLCCPTSCPLQIQPD